MLLLASSFLVLIFRIATISSVDLRVFKINRQLNKIDKVRLHQLQLQMLKSEQGASKDNQLGELKKLQQNQLHIQQFEGGSRKEREDLLKELEDGHAKKQKELSEKIDEGHRYRFHL